MSNEYSSVNEFIDSFSAHIATETHKLLNGKTAKHNGTVRRAMIIRFISNMIKLLLIDILTEERESLVDEAEWGDKIVKTFQASKLRLGNEVAEAFSSVMTELRGKPQDYYCAITFVPEPESKLLN